MRKNPINNISDSPRIIPVIETSNERIVLRDTIEGLTVSKELVSEIQNEIPSEPYKLDNLIRSGADPNVSLPPLSSTRLDGYDNLQSVSSDLDSLLSSAPIQPDSTVEK